MDEVCTNLYLGNNWRLGVNTDGSLSLLYWNTNNMWTVVQTWPVPSLMAGLQQIAPVSGQLQ